MNILSVDKKICTGCAACYNICPKDAIYMQDNGEGFLYPAINKQKCVDCGLCYKRCPAVEYDFDTPEIPDCYAVWAEKSIREQSSSGGMFTVLAEHILEKKGVVVGAAWDKDLHVEHIIIDRKEDLYKLRGSKYVQSIIDGTLFRRIKTLLENGTNVLFSGCPCQVAGLKKFLGNDYDNLVTIDIVCHGVPSPAVLDSYVSEVAEGRKVKHIDFRDKKYFGWSTITAVKFEDNSEYVKSYFESPWYIGFLQGIIIRENCGQCKYAKTQRVGDITLGDFWQIQKIDPKCNDWRGTGLVLINTSKGQKVFDVVKPDLSLAEKKRLEDELPFNGQLVRPTKITVQRQMFFDAFQRNHSYLKSLQQATDNTRDVGIVGFWSANNYGSVITYYALKEVIEDLGYSVGMIELPLEFNDTFGDMMSRRFVDKHYYTTGRLSKNKYRDLNERFKTFIIGSDQVWNPVYIKNYGYYMFLDFVADNKKRIAYAASIGKEKYDIPYKQRQEVSYYLNKFDAVSVREKQAVETCKTDLNCPRAEHVLDPVWLCKGSDYDKIIKDATFNEKDDFIFSYILDPTEDKKTALEYAVDKLGLKHYNIEDVRRKHKEGDVMIPNTLTDASMEDWLYCLKNCKFVITDSHHGIVFAIMFNKPFICFANPSRTMSRFTSLFDLLKIEDRLIYDPKAIMNDAKYFDTPNYKEINKIVEKEKIRSLSWLKSALEKSVKTDVISDYDILYGKIKNVGDNAWRHGESIKKIENDISDIKTGMENSSANGASLNDIIAKLREAYESERSRMTEEIHDLKNRIDELTSDYKKIFEELGSIVKDKKQ